MTMGIKQRLDSTGGHIVASKAGAFTSTPRAGKSEWNLNRLRSINFEIVGVVHDATCIAGERSGGDKSGGDKLQIRSSSSLTFTPGISQGLLLEGARPHSEMAVAPERPETEPKSHNRVPVLGPTRQQTELYMKNLARRKKEETTQPVIPIDGPTRALGQSGSKLVPGDIAVFEDKAANAVLLEAENQIKSGYPTLATSSMVARRHRPDVLDDFEDQADVKFLSELVKPVKYRWKFQKDKVKTLAPSKHGFHQRSQSPTFQRLVDANERLQHLISGESVEGSLRSNTDFFDTQSEVCPASVIRPHLRYVRTEPSTTSTRSSLSSNSLPATRDVLTIGRFDIKPDIRTIEPIRTKYEDLFAEEDDNEEETSTVTPSPTPSKNRSPSQSASAQQPIVPPPQPVSTRKTLQDFKVDFKRHDSHSELHLFLPQIQENNSRGATPDTPTKVDRVKFSLPPIDDTTEPKSLDDDKVKVKRRQRNGETRKKKKAVTRVKSGADDREIRDHLNDVPTLISLENEKDYHPASLCMFENCPHHQHRKSKGIRQA